MAKSRSSPPASGARSPMGSANTSSAHPARRRTFGRAAGSDIRSENLPDQKLLHLVGRDREVNYAYRQGAVFRSVNGGPWARLLENVKSCSMQADPREKVTAWRWELELQPRTKATIRA